MAEEWAGPAAARTGAWPPAVVLLSFWLPTGIGGYASLVLLFHLRRTSHLKIVGSIANWTSGFPFTLLANPASDQRDGSIMESSLSDSVIPATSTSLL